MVSNNIRDKLDGDVLDLSMMSLKDVPVREIASIPKATILDLSSNQLKALPPSFGSQLPHLLKLDLSANKLTVLPKSFQYLVNLKHLDLYNNQLTDLPESLHNLKQLRFLDIKNNPLNPTLQKIVGPCLTKKECEAASKKLVIHFTKERQLAIDQEIMANKLKEQKEQQQREEAESQRQSKEKKAAKRERKNDNKVQKVQQQQQEVLQQQKQAAHVAKTANGNANRQNKKTSKGGNKSRSSGCLSWLNVLLFACLSAASCWTIHLHTEGDYSEAGLRAAVPRLQTNLYRLRNNTVDALQPVNLRATGRVVYTAANSTLYQAGSTIQRAAYSSQEFLEVYTGDLTPYTSKVSQWCGVAYQWTKVQSCAVCDWLYKQDWQGMLDACLTFILAVWAKIQEGWSAAMRNPTVKAAWDATCEYSRAALAWLQQQVSLLVLYLQKNGPVWLEAAADSTYSAYTYAKDTVQSLVK